MAKVGDTTVPWEQERQVNVMENSATFSFLGRNSAGIYYI